MYLACLYSGKEGIKKFFVDHLQDFLLSNIRYNIMLVFIMYCKTMIITAIRLQDQSSVFYNKSRFRNIRQLALRKYFYQEVNIDLVLCYAIRNTVLPSLS